MIGAGSSLSLMLLVGHDVGVRCSTYPDATPVLSLSTGGICVSLSIADRDQIPAEAVEFTREFARQTATYAAECQRLHTEQQATAKASTAGKARPPGKRT